MHNNEPTATLLQVLRDLSRTIEQMAPQQALTAIERDLLLSEMQQLYARVLEWPVAVAKNTVAEVAGALKTETTATAAEIQADAKAEKEATNESVMLQEQIATVTEEVMEQLAEVVEEAVENALESGQEMAFDIELQMAHKNDQAAEETAVAKEENSPVDFEPQAEEAPEQTEKTTIIQTEAATITPSVSSVAFSLSGVLQKNGDSQLVMAHLKLKPIDDLKAGIGLNEKFLFIRELFKNDHVAYAEAIEQLNASSNIKEAEAIIANKLLPIYHWDLDTEAAVSFLHLVFRRFAPKA